MPSSPLSEAAPAALGGAVALDQFRKWSGFSALDPESTSVCDVLDILLFVQEAELCIIRRDVNPLTDGVDEMIETVAGERQIAEDWATIVEIGDRVNGLKEPEQCVSPRNSQSSISCI